MPRRALAVADRDGDRSARPATMSPPAKIPGWPVIMSGPTLTAPSAANCDARHLRAGSRCRSPGPSASTIASALSVSNRPVGCGRPLASSSIISTVRSGPTISLMRGQPLDLDAFLDRLVGLEGVRRHVRAVAPIDDERFVGAQALRRCAPHPSPCCRRRRRRRGGRAAAARRLVTSCSSETASSTRTASRAGISTCLPTPAPMAMKTASKPPAAFSASTSSTLWLSDDLDAHGLDARDLAHQIRARQPIGRNAEMHHAAGQRSRLVDLDRVAQAREMIGGRQSARAGADHQHALAARRAPRP